MLTVLPRGEGSESEIRGKYDDIIFELEFLKGKFFVFLSAKVEIGQIIG